MSEQQQYNCQERVNYTYSVGDLARNVTTKLALNTQLAKESSSASQLSQSQGLVISYLQASIDQHEKDRKATINTNAIMIKRDNTASERDDETDIAIAESHVVGNSDCKQSFQPSIIKAKDVFFKRPIKFNHADAEEIYKKTDPEKDSLKMVIGKIHDAPGGYTLKGLVKELGTEFVHCETQEAINILEAIYEALEKEKHFIKCNNLDCENRDELFEEAITRMYKNAKKYDKTELLKALETLYHLTQE